MTGAGPGATIGRCSDIHNLQASGNGQARPRGGGVGRPGVAADPTKSHLDPTSRAMDALRRRGERGRGREGERRAARELAAVKALAHQDYGPSKYTTYNQDRLDAHQGRTAGRRKGRERTRAVHAPQLAALTPPKEPKPMGRPRSALPAATARFALAQLDGGTSYRRLETLLATQGLHHTRQWIAARHKDGQLAVWAAG